MSIPWVPREYRLHADSDLPLAEVLGWYRGITRGGCAPLRENEWSAAPLRENELSAEPNETELSAGPSAPAREPADPIRSPKVKGTDNRNNDNASNGTDTANKGTGLRIRSDRPR